jgi:cell division protein FtsB
MRLLTLLAMIVATLPAVAYAQDSGGTDLVSWRLGIPAAVLAAVVGLAQWIKRRLSDGALTITATSKSAKAIAEEHDTLKREHAHLADENADLKRELDEAKARLQDQLVKAEEREARLFERLITEADARRSGDNDAVG